MKRYLSTSLVLALSLGVVRLGVAGPDCANDNGDVNGDNGIDLSDAVYNLAFLFQGGPAPVLFCVDAGTGEDCAKENGDVNGDDGIDLSDAVYSLAFSFQGGPAPVPQCPMNGDPEICTGGGDEDNDGATDCDDCDCTGHASCPQDAPSALPDTGQILCYDDQDPDPAVGNPVEVACGSAMCLGQDGFYTNGCTLTGTDRFALNVGPDGTDDVLQPDAFIDDTVTDLCTGLTWQRDTADTSGDGALMFPGDDETWDGALRYCEDLDFGGFDDWRLPNIRELQSIVDYGRSGPALDTTCSTCLSAAGGAIPGAYWSSTSVASPEHLGRAWHVNFSIGIIDATGFKNNDPPAVEGRIRAVRGVSGLLLPDTGQTLCYDDENGLISTACDTPPCPYGALDCADAPATCPGQDGSYSTGCSMECRFVENGDDTVTDTCLGLMWQKDTADTGGPLTWCEALDHGEGLSFAGKTDWRLPNVRELHSLLDYGRHAPALDPVFDMAERDYWTSTSQNGFACKAWSVGFGRSLPNLTPWEGGSSNTEYKDGFNTISGSPRALLPLRAVRDAP